ncbi:uncharacterized protein LOC143219133 [Lasioglossum baleicum]|uniref:uncharacterized protein LOC143219133 n=1 Tax=Lasioglossum baleicum TaxID=434251 RepID=UPI003FCDEA60
MASGNRVALTINQRMEILKDLEIFSIRDIAKKYKVHHSTIWRIQRNATRITDFANKGNLDKQRKVTRRPLYEELEERLYVWFVEMKAIGAAISDAILIQKANEFKTEYPVCSDFKASRGWIAKFKQRHQIRLVNTYCEKACTDEDGADSFVHNFKRYIEEEDISLENIYNMNETGLLWKALPSRTVARGTEQRVSVSGYKMRKDRLTVGLCANATGTHKITPLVVHKFKKPRALRDLMDQLPVIFKTQIKAGMNQPIFVDWFDNHFKKAVRQYQLENRLCGKVILLVNNSINHKFPIDYKHDDTFEVRYLPPNTEPLIQPMDQGVIEKLKRRFRHKLSQHLLARGCGIEESLEKYTIKDCLHTISASWEDLTCSDIQNAWKNIIPNMQTVEQTNEDTITSEMRQAWSHISQHNGTVEDIENYFTACSEEERRLSRTFEERAADEGDEEWDAEEGDEERCAEEGDEERAAEQGDEERAAEQGDEDRTVEEADEEKAAEEGDEENGMKLHPKIRKDFEDVFEQFKRLRKYIPRSARYHLDGLKFTILVRDNLKDLMKQYNKSENDLKALQSVGEIVGEVLKQLTEEKFIVKATNGPRYVVGCRQQLDKNKLKSATRVALDTITLTIMRYLPSKVNPLVYNMSHEDPGNVTYDVIGGLSEKLRELTEVIELPLQNPELFQRVGITPPKGCLSYSPPGTGETLLAQQTHSSNDEVDNIDYHFEQARLESFENWPVPHIMEPKRLAAAGFYYTGEGDKVKCFECHVVIGRWVEGDNPMVDHQRWSARCRFIREINCGNVPIGVDPNTVLPPRPRSRDVCGPYGVKYRPTSGPDNHNLTSELQLPSTAELSCSGRPKGPVHPEYASYDARLRTFETWPKMMAQNKKPLADAGFYYTGKSDETLCHHCGVGLKDWELESDPWEQHAKWFSKCYYLLTVKGQDYVNKVTGQHISPPSKEESNPGPSSQSSSTDNAIESIRSVTESVKGSIEDLPNANMQNNKTIDDARMCKICYNGVLGVVFLPCGHIVACVKCAPGITTCALCREPVTMVVRAFFS